jgi:hypothetical protein
MSNRSAKFASALVASILAGANFTAMAQNATSKADTKVADSCLSGPKGAAPAGSHWYYHLDRTTKKQCWYVGEAKGRGTRAATAQQQPASAPEATAADAAQPQAQPSPQPAMHKSVAEAHAEWTSPQAAAAPAATADANQASAAAADSSAVATPADANAQSSPVSARWLDAASMAGSNGSRHAASQPSMVVAQADTPPQQQASTVVATAPAAVEAPAEKTSASTQTLLIVMVGALALAGLVSALVFTLTRTRTPPYEIRDEWRAPWDSLHTEQTPPMPAGRARPLRLAEATPRRSEPPVPRRGSPRAADETEDNNRQIAAMLKRLARSTAN